MKDENQPKISAEKSNLNSQPTPPQNQPTSAPSQTPQVPRKTKKGLIIGIISAVVAVVLLVSGLLWYFLWYQNPERVLLTAITKVQQSKQIATSTVITSDLKYPVDDKELEFERLEIDFGSERTPKFDANAKLSLKFDGESYSAQASALVTDSGEVFFKVANLTDSVNKILKSQGYKLSDKALERLDKVDDKWVKYGISDLKKDDKKSGEAAECALDAVKKNFNDENRTRVAVENYQKNPFVRVKNSQSKDGNIGYEVSLDATNLKNYIEASQDDALLEDLSNCTSTSSYTRGKTSSSASGRQLERAVEQLNKVKATVWVSRWSHDLRGVDITLDGSDLLNQRAIRNSDIDDFSVKIETKIDAKKGVTTEEPSGAMSIDELTKSLQGLFADSSSVTKL